MSKRTFILLTLAVVVVLVVGVTASALATTHGNYSTTTDACAGCHVAHAAGAPKLLKVGPTQTKFCYVCHGSGAPGSPYDIQDGRTFGSTADAVYQSTAGGFDRLWISGTTFQDVTSRHSVIGYAYDTISAGSRNLEDPSLKFTGTIPGGTNKISGSGLVCGSCHNPHAGGTNPPNPRLLRTSISLLDSNNNVVTVTNLSVSFATETVSSSVYNPAYRVTGYVSGSAAWCAACHDKFNKGQGSGHDKGTDYYYRHAMSVSASVYTGNTNLTGDPNTGTSAGTPLESGKVVCLTCHRAHATTAQMTSAYTQNWPRDIGDPQQYGTGTGTTSALLRMKNRGVCYNCHGAAQANLPTTP